jgi:hypothetical protein
MLGYLSSVMKIAPTHKLAIRRYMRYPLVLFVFTLLLRGNLTMRMKILSSYQLQVVDVNALTAKFQFPMLVPTA